MLTRRHDSVANSTIATKMEISLSADQFKELSAMVSFRKSRNKNNRRFNDEQIKSLETMFEMESRSELLTKQLLANELGLQPCQVAIWFQNRRARLRSKLIEQEYGILKSHYDTLASKLDSLKQENQCLMIQLQRLRNLMEKAQASRNRGVGQIRKSIDEEYDRDTKSEAGGVTNLPSECYKHESRVPLYYDTSDNIRYFGEETDILNMTQVVPDGSFTSSENWCSFKSSSALEHPSCSSERWDLWP